MGPTSPMLLRARHAQAVARGRSMPIAASATPQRVDAVAVSKRQLLMAGVLAAWSTLLPARSSAVSISPVTIQPQLAPNQSLYDATDSDLRAAAQLLQDALNAPTVAREEQLWTEIIETYGGKDANWVRDLVGRAWGNRGNARSRQGKLEEALGDYNKAIELCPWSVDPVLNRGVVLEQLRRFDEAIVDYRAVLDVEPSDPAAWNNLGNASAGLGRWEEAAQYYGQAAKLAPQFSFAEANQMVALFELGRTETAIRGMRSLLRKYPEFPDMRAALTAALWSIGKEGEAETNWQRVSDPRYRDMAWLEETRRWPPKLRSALQAFFAIKSVPAA